MKYFVTSVGLFACLGLIATAMAQDHDFFSTQGEVMKSGPPKFLLVSSVDVDAKTLTGMSTIERHNPKPVVSAFHRTLKLSEINVTNAVGAPIAAADLPAIKGKLAVLHEGINPLSAAYMGLFREDTIVISIVHKRE